MKKLLTRSVLCSNIHLLRGKRKNKTQEWRNWQTRTVQVRVKAISWGFKSPFLQKGFREIEILFVLSQNYIQVKKKSVSADHCGDALFIINSFSFAFLWQAF